MPLGFRATKKNVILFSDAGEALQIPFWDGGSVVTQAVRIASAVVLACLGSAGVALAQEAPGAAASGQLGEITVTAERRVENVKDVPISIATVSGEKLDALTAGGGDLRVLNAQVPSLVAEGSYGRTFPRFYIRGYGNADFRAAASQPVSLVYDDIVQENPFLKGFPIFDLDQVEVLNGPQGSLFGRNTPAGVVKFDSTKPKLDSFGGYFDASTGTYLTTNLEGAMNIPLGSQWAARVSGLYQHRDNWVHNTVPGPTPNYEGYNDGALRGQLLYKPNDDFSALFNIHSRLMTGTEKSLRANIYVKGTNDLVPGFDPSQVSFDARNNQRIQVYGGNIHLQWDFDGFRLSSITGVETVRFFGRQDVDGGYGSLSHQPTGPGRIPFPSESGAAIPQHDQETQEFRIESKSAGPFTWQAGVYYFHEYFRSDSNTYSTFANNVLTGTTTAKQVSRSYAAFVSAKYDFTDRLSLRAGVRYTDDTKKLDNSLVPGIDALNGLNEHRDDSKPTGDVSLLYTVSPDTNVYARIATGYRGSNLQPASTTVPQSSAGPEDNTSYEAGVKSDLFEKRARISLTGYYYRVRHLQLTEVGGGGTSNQLLSADHATGYGVEFNADAYVTPHFLLTAGVSYNFTQIQDPTLAVAGCAAAAGCTILSPSNGKGEYLANGNPLPQAPRWIVNGTARYGIPLGNGGELFALTDWAYRSSVDFYLYKAAEFIGKPLLLGGLRAGYDWGNGKYEVAVFSRNILNRVVGVSGLDFDNLAGTVNDPRTFGAEIKARF